MQIVCSWCEKFLGDKEPLSDGSITHSICGECYREAKDKIKEFRKELREGVVTLGEGKMLKRRNENVKVL
jgi:hypothetical protein